MNDQLEAVFRKVFRQPELAISRATAARDIDAWDSLMHIQLMYEIEQAFGIRFTMGELTKFKNVGEIQDSIASKMK